MDAAQVGDRSKKPEQKYKTQEEYLMRESFYESPYPLEGHWMWNLKKEYYTLIGEYIVDTNTTLYRWELDESKRKLISNPDKYPHIFTIIIKQATKKP